MQDFDRDLPTKSLISRSPDDAGASDPDLFDEPIPGDQQTIRPQRELRPEKVLNKTLGVSISLGELSAILLWDLIQKLLKRHCLPI